MELRTEGESAGFWQSLRLMKYLHHLPIPPHPEPTALLWTNKSRGTCGCPGSGATGGHPSDAPPLAVLSKPCLSPPDTEADRFPSLIIQPSSFTVSQIRPPCRLKIAWQRYCHLCEFTLSGRGIVGNNGQDLGRKMCVEVSGARLAGC